MIYDSIHHARLLATIKYVSLASVALYALCAMPLPIGRLRFALAYVILAGTVIAAVQRIQEGPPQNNGEWALDWPLCWIRRRDRMSRWFFISIHSGVRRECITWLLRITRMIRIARSCFSIDRQMRTRCAQLMKYRKRSGWLGSTSSGQDAPVYFPGWTAGLYPGISNSGAIFRTGAAEPRIILGNKP